MVRRLERVGDLQKADRRSELVVFLLLFFVLTHCLRSLFLRGQTRLVFRIREPPPHAPAVH